MLYRKTKSILKIKFEFILLGFLIFNIIPPVVYANDTLATISSQEIEYKKSPDISLEQEILKISPTKIEVDYVFFNHSDKEITADVAFPLPLAPINDSIFPNWDEAYRALSFLDENPGTKDKNAAGFDISNISLRDSLQNAPFIDFNRTVNGSSYGFNYRILAKTKEGKDITQILLDNQIPISATFLMGFEQESPLLRNVALKQKLEKLNLLDKNGKPIWQNQTIYFWKQVFAPKTETRVTHSYRPATGMYWLDVKNEKDANDTKEVKVTKDVKDLKDAKTLADIKFYTRDLDKKDWKDYALSEADTQKLLTNFKNNTSIPAKEVQYILTTGNNWRDSIKKFKLEILNPENDIIAFKSPGKITKTSNNNYVVEIDNFKPKEELKVMYITNKE